MPTTYFYRAAYDHFGTQLAVSGERDEESCVVTCITAADSQVDLFDLLEPVAVELIAERIDAQLARAAVKHNAGVRLEHAQHDAEMAAA